ncbi:MAG: hypothetical protein HY690_09655 [Chloroflexi bacterium]|nr:hypothetical protein [Chloroflexota bacterium]
MMPTPGPVVRRASRTVVGLPLFLRVGLVVFALGGGGDLAYHLLPLPLAEVLTPLLGAEAARAHLATLVGMGLVFTGVVQRGLGHGR